MTPGYEAHGAQYLEYSSLGLEVLGAEALGDGVDARGVSQHVGPASLGKINFYLFYFFNFLSLNPILYG